MQNNYLYETTAVNKDGVNGTAYIAKEDGLQVTVSNPLNNQPGTNPEELLGLSLSTCFNATIQAILKAKNLTRNSRVAVPVQLKQEADDSGYFFEVMIHAAIEDLDSEKATEIMTTASHRCPVYKLIRASQTVSLKTVPY